MQDADNASLDSDGHLGRWLADRLDILAYRARPGDRREVWYVSPRLRATLGYTDAQLRGDDAFQRLVHPEDRTRAAQALEAARSGDVCVRGEYRLIGADQRVVWIADENALAHDGHGRPTIQGFVRDVTEDRVAAGAAFDIQARMRLLAEQLPAVIWTTDAGGDLTSIMGRAAIHLQLGVDEFPGPATARQHSRALAGETVALEVQFSGRTFEAHLEPLEDSAGAIVGVIGIGLDVTERRRAARRLRESERRLETARKMEALGRLAGGIAHDFNNLLTSILGNAQLLVEGLEDDDPLQDEARLIASVGERGAALIDQLLTFASRRPLEPQVLEIDAVVTAMEDMLAGLLGDRGRLVLSLHSESGRVRIDRAALEQIVLNLVVNARDAMLEGGLVTIETHAAAEPRPVVALTVADTGSGMDARTRSRIFEPFFTTKAPGQGTGLGLATVYGIVEQSDGEITVDSEPGRGSRFAVTFPSVAGPAAPR